MSLSKISALAGIVAFSSTVAAHGLLSGIVADGVYYQGYNPNFQYQNPPPTVIGWSIPKDENTGYVAPDAYGSDDIICHIGATNAGMTAPVTAGSKVDLQWTKWPETHQGPVMDYLANCNGDCETVDKKTLKFFKIDAQGLLDGSTIPGKWASDTLIANNNTWTVTIPADIAPGNYVLRHEIIAMHFSGNPDGAQNYPQCVNLKVSGSGTSSPEGVSATTFYKMEDEGIDMNIYEVMSTYPIPGPTLYTAGSVNVPASTVAAEATSSTSSEAAAAVTTSTTPAAAETTIPTAVAAIISTPSAIEETTPTKSACKPKTTTSHTTTSLTTSTLSSATTVYTTITSSSPQSSSVSSATSSSPKPTTSSLVQTSSLTTAPTGTTLSTLLSWLSSFYTSHANTPYDGNTLVRRHARDLAERKLAKYDLVAGDHRSGRVSSTSVVAGGAVGTGVYPVVATKTATSVVDVVATKTEGAEIAKATHTKEVESAEVEYDC